jgi:predicted solute-binding protein
MQHIIPQQQDIAEAIGIADMPENVQEQFFADAGALVFQTALQKTVRLLDEERMHALGDLLSASNNEPENETARIAVWQYVQENVPEFGGVLEKEAKKLYEQLVEHKEAYEAEI